MASKQTPTLTQRINMKLESFLLAGLVPKDRVGAVFGKLFKLPILLKRVGLGFLIPGNVLILTTTGRRTGIERETPVEFGPGPEEGVYLVMAGWEGNTDWYRNISANPEVKVWLKGRQWRARAEPVPERLVAERLKTVTASDPSTARIWGRWSDVPIDGSDESFLAAAPHFPSLYLWPLDTEEEALDE